MLNNWDNENVIIAANSRMTMIKLSGAYSKNDFGQWIFVGYNTNRIYVIGKNYTTWSPLKTIAYLDDTVEASNKLKTNKLTNENLDDIKDENFTSYYAIYNNTCKNRPEGTFSFGLNSYRISDASYGQVLFDINQIRMFVRYYNVNYKKWSEWEKLMTNKDITKIEERLSIIENKLEEIS